MVSFVKSFLYKRVDGNFTSKVLNSLKISSPVLLSWDLKHSGNIPPIQGFSKRPILSLGAFLKSKGAITATEMF